MDWTRIIAAANGRPQSLAWFIRRGTDADVAALATLLLLEEPPHPAAALVAAARSPDEIAPLVQMALAPQIDAALAAWRADPQWVGRAVGATMRGGLARGAAGVVGALRDRPAALRDAAAMVLRDGDVDAIVWLLAALGADGWRALGDDQRAALLQKAPADALGWVWGALDDAQRAAATPGDAARLIGRIGAAAWRATDPELRRRLIDAVVHDPWWIAATAPAWTGMTDDERERLATAVIAHGDAERALTLLDDLGAAGRATLTVKQRAALERRAMESLSAWRVPAWRAALERRAMDHPDAWRVLAWRAADGGWTALKDDERRAVLAAAEEAPWGVARLLRAVGAAGWNAMRAAEQARIAGAVRRAPDVFFRCPPALWGALAGAALPSATRIPAHVLASWRAEDAESDLGALPPTHQTLVLALAPWRWKDAALEPVRVRRLVAAWGAMTADDRAALATAHPSVLAPITAAARLRGGASAAVDAVGATVARVASATGGADAKRAVGVMLRTPAAWRAWMVGFAPTDGDPSEVWDAWRRAARRGVVPDSALCARLTAPPRESRARGARRRA